MMESVILAGGLGTRLQEVISSAPKPLAPINGIPFLDMLLEKLSLCKELSKVVLALGYKADQIVKRYSAHTFPFTLAFSCEHEPLGTGGALKLALEQISAQEILCLNGDTYLDISLEAFLAFHRENSADFSLACCHVDDAARYGSIRMDETRRILSFNEKQAGSGWINAGVYLLHPALLSASSRIFSLEKELFPALLSKRVFGYPCKGLFIDIGTKQSYFEAQELLYGKS